MNATVPVPCNGTALFNASTLVLFGTNAVCSWPSPKRLVVEYASSQPIHGGETVVLLGGVISRSDVAVFLPPTNATLISRKPAPRPLRAVMSNDGGSVSVLFNGTSSGELLGTFGSVNCDGVFANANFGSGSSCYWDSLTSLRIVLGKAAGIMPGVQYTADTVSTLVACAGVNATLSVRLLGGVVAGALNGILRTEEACLTVMSPEAPQPPVIRLSGPSVASPCVPVVVDASGTVDPTGRQPRFSWDVTPLNDAATSSPYAGNAAFVNALAVGAKALRLAVGDLLPHATVNFRVTVTNFLGASAFTTLNVTVAESALPVAAISGGVTQSVLANTPVTLKCVASLVSCSQNDTFRSDPGLNFTWQLVSQTRDPLLTSPSYVFHEFSATEFRSFVARNPTQLQFPALVVGVVYVVEVTVRVRVQPNVTASAQTVVSVSSAGVQAVILGGNREVGVLSDCVIDASTSRDLDGLNATVVPFAYSWTCSDADTAAVCVNADGVLLDLSVYASQDNSALVIPGGTLRVSRYRFGVTVSKGRAGGLIPYHFRSDSASVVIGVLPGLPPQITMSFSSTVANPSDRVVLAADVVADPRAGNVSLLWSSKSLNSSALAAITLSSVLTLDFLAIIPNLPQGRYTFVLTAATRDGSSSSGEVVVVVNSPPRGGFVDATPRTGTELSTPFELSAGDWIDEDAPLSYRFAVMNDAGVETYVSAEPQSSNVLAGVLLSRGQNVTVVGYVSDAFNGITRCVVDVNSAVVTLRVSGVNITSTSGALSLLDGNVDSLLLGSLSQGNTAGALNVIAIFSSVLSDASDPCLNVDCGSHGRCDVGVCVCDAGYNGTLCESALPVVPVNGSYSEWSAFEPCPVSCGGGLQKYVRRYTAAQHGGVDVVPPIVLTEYRVCGDGVCTDVVNGGYSDWVSVSACNNSCPGDAKGDYSGYETFVRYCNHPTPSGNGQNCSSLGPDTEIRKCVLRVVWMPLLPQ